MLEQQSRRGAGFSQRSSRERFRHLSSPSQRECSRPRRNWRPRYPSNIPGERCQDKCNTAHIMNAKEKTTPTTKRTPRKASRPGLAKASLLAHQPSGTLEESRRRMPISGKPPRRQDYSPAEQVTVVEAKINVGLGNILFIRGQGDGLSWFEGVPLNCVDPDDLGLVNQPSQGKGGIQAVAERSSLGQGRGRSCRSGPED